MQGVLWGNPFLLEMHYRQEKVVMEPELIIKFTQAEHLFKTVKAGVSDVSPHQAVVVLLDEAIVIFAIGLAA